MAIQATDLLVVNRGGVNYKITGAQFKTPGVMQGTDLLCVQRGQQLYQVSLNDLYSNLGKLQVTDYLIVERGEQNYALQLTESIPNLQPSIKLTVDTSKLPSNSTRSVLAVGVEGAQGVDGVQPQLRLPDGTVIFFRGGTDSHQLGLGDITTGDCYLYGTYTKLSFSGSVGLTTVATGAAGVWDQIIPNPSDSFGSQMFFNCESLTTIDNYDLPVKQCTGMFQGTREFNDSGIANLNVTGVTAFESMFRDSLIFNSSIDGWDVTSAKFFQYMFMNAPAYNKSMTTWGTKTSNVQSFALMFDSAIGFNQPLDGWDVSGANAAYGAGDTGAFDRMFNGATIFDRPLTSWCVSNVPSEPANFSSNSAQSPGNNPNWGAPCA